jgi:hypothetical protein
LATIIDVELDHHFAGSLAAAREAAAVEAANTGGAVLIVEAVDVGDHKVTFIGTLPEMVLKKQSDAEVAMPQARSLHTTWGAVLAPSGTIGFLVLAQPVLCRSHEADSPAQRRIAVSLPRAFSTVSPVTLGPVCCIQCRRPISQERLKAVPGKRICLTCQKLKEEEAYASR